MVSNIVTVDVEDWYHICGVDEQVPPSRWSECEGRVERNTEKILDVFRKKNIKATFFVLGYIAYRYPEIVRMIVNEGHEVASHGFSHTQVYKQEPQTFEADLKKSKVFVDGSWK